MDISIVKEGAVLECSLGTETSKLKVPCFHGAELQDGNQANISDSVGEINIPSFCKCRRKRIGDEPQVGFCEKEKVPLYVCKPTTAMKWVKGQKSCILDGDLALLKICIIPCIYGGIIRFKDSGQNE